MYGPVFAEKKCRHGTATADYVPASEGAGRFWLEVTSYDVLISTGTNCRRIYSTSRLRCWSGSTAAWKRGTRRWRSSVPSGGIPCWRNSRRSRQWPRQRSDWVGSCRRRRNARAISTITSEWSITARYTYNSRNLLTGNAACTRRMDVLPVSYIVNPSR